jgi:hypothetical protein
MWKKPLTHPGMPSTPRASDSGSPERSGIIYGFDSHIDAGGLSPLKMVLVCHPKLPTTWIPTLYSGCRLSITLQNNHTRLSKRVLYKLRLKSLGLTFKL